MFDKIALLQGLTTHAWQRFLCKWFARKRRSWIKIFWRNFWDRCFFEKMSSGKMFSNEDVYEKDVLEKDVPEKDVLEKDVLENYLFDDSTKSTFLSVIIRTTLHAWSGASTLWTHFEVAMPCDSYRLSYRVMLVLAEAKSRRLYAFWTLSIDIPCDEISCRDTPTSVLRFFTLPKVPCNASSRRNTFSIVLCLVQKFDRRTVSNSATFSTIPPKKPLSPTWARIPAAAPADVSNSLTELNCTTWSSRCSPLCQRRPGFGPEQRNSHQNLNTI